MVDTSEQSIGCSRRSGRYVHGFDKLTASRDIIGFATNIFACRSQKAGTISGPILSCIRRDGSFMELCGYL